LLRGAIKQATLASAFSAAASVVTFGMTARGRMEMFWFRAFRPGLKMRKKSHKYDIEQLLQKRYTFH